MATENPKESPGLLRRLLPSRLSRGGRGKDGDSRPTQPKRPGRITQNRECVRLGAERLAQPVRTSDNDSMDSYRESLTSGNVTAEVHVEIDQAAQLGKPANEMPDEKRNKRFDKMLESKEVELQRIRKICWSGIPMRYRPQFWLMLMGIMPLAKARRQASLEKRIKEYESFVHIHSENGNTCYTAEEIKSFKQIKLDLPRTQPGVKLFHHPKIEQAISRILTIFAIRHPATGYVQGMNDIVIPLLFVFIQEIVQIDEKSEVVGIAFLDTISEDNWIAIEAKAFWSFCRIMESIQDHYTRDQPGIQQKMFYLRVLVDKIDGISSNS